MGHETATKSLLKIVKQLQMLASVLWKQQQLLFQQQMVEGPSFIWGVLVCTCSVLSAVKGCHEDTKTIALGQRYIQPCILPLTVVYAISEVK